MVIRRCRQMLRDEDEAVDAAQDTFVQILRRGDNLQIEFPSSLLYRVATNVCLNRIRDRKRGVNVEDQDVIEQIAASDDARGRWEAWSDLRSLFGRHDDLTRTMAVYHYVDGMTLEEVARETGYSMSGVRKRLRSLRHTLKELEAQVG